MKYVKLIFGLALATAIMFMAGCDDDDDGPSAITIVSIEASGADVLSGETVTKDLNGATAATGVPVNPVIVITFSKEIDAATASATAIQVITGTTAVDATIAVSGAVVTVTPAELDKGTDYTLSISDALLAVDGGIFVSTSRSFSTGGVAPVTPPHEADQVAYWDFDGDAEDEMGNYTTVSETDITYVTDRHGQATSTASFDGDASIIEIADGDQLMATDDFTLSFWIKSNSSQKFDPNPDDADNTLVTRGQFVLGLAGWNGFQFEIAQNYANCKLAAQYELDDATTAAQDLWWSTTGNLGWMGWTYDQDVSAAGGLGAIISDEWAHFVVTYNATSKVGAIYINGVLRKSQDFNLYGDTHPLYRTVGMGYAGNDAPGNRLALGFIQGSENRIITDDWANPIGFPDNNHFNGEMDDVRIFHAAFAQADVTALYDAEKP